LNNKATVAITKCETYEAEPLNKALREILDSAFLPTVKGKVILLKPNILSDAKPEKAITTRPEIIRELIKILFEKGAKTIYVGDSPGIHGNSFFPRSSGIGKVCQEEGAIWAEFAKDPVMTPIGGLFKLNFLCLKFLTKLM
jgi:uncharacterized protein (DUF362 family)